MDLDNLEDNGTKEIVVEPDLDWEKWPVAPAGLPSSAETHLMSFPMEPVRIEHTNLVIGV